MGPNVCFGADRRRRTVLPLPSLASAAINGNLATQRIDVFDAAAWRLAEARGFDFRPSVRPCSLARTTPRASCLTLGVLSLVLRGPQHTPYIYQMVSVCIIEGNSALVSV